MMIGARNSHIWSIADQMVISGCNFFLAVLLARSLGLEGFGAFAVAQGYLFYSQAVMLPLVAWPLMSELPAVSCQIERRRLLSAFFGFAVLVAMASTVLVSFVALFVGKIVVTLSIEALLLPLAFALAANQLQDFLRRTLIAIGESRRALFYDCFTYGGLLVTLYAFSLAQHLAPEIVLLTIAGYCVASIPAMMWALRVRPDFIAAGRLIKTHARLSRNLLLFQQLQWIASSGVVLIGAGVVGQAAAGVIRVIQSALGPVNVVLQWMENVIPVRSAQLYGSGGRRALSSFLMRCSGLGVFVTFPALVVIAWLGSAFLGMLYGLEYIPFASLLLLQGAYYFLSYQYRLVSYFFRTIGESSALPVSAFVWAVVGCFAAVVLPARIAENGVMAALLAGQIAALVVLLLGLKRTRSNCANPALYAVLRRKDGSPHLIIPITSWLSVVSSLELYFPSRWTGISYKALLQIGLYAAAKFHLVRSTTRPAEYYKALDEVLEIALQYPASQVAVLIGAPGPLTKCTARFMDLRVRPLAYGRVADSPAAAAALQAESAVLMQLKERGVATGVPTVLTERALQFTPGYMLIETAGPDSVSSNVLTKGHFDFLLQLAEGRRTSWRNLVAEIESELYSYPSLAGNETVRRAIQFLRDAQIEDVGVAIEHGDFAPWNIRQRPDGGLFVFDWEDARLDGTPWIDAIHFMYQTLTLVFRMNDLRKLLAIRAVFKNEISKHYADAFPEWLDHENHLIAAYLLKVTAIGMRSGCLVNDNLQANRLRLLGLAISC